MQATIGFVSYLPFAIGTSIGEQLPAVRTARGLSRETAARLLGR
jgi:hypothetical protein